ncbi:MAG: lysophospholipase [Burkholderiales bacterium]
MTDPLVIVENLNQNPTNFNGVSMILPQVIKPVVTHLSHQDRLLAFYKWVGMPLKPKATVLLVHGLGEHMGRYTHVANFLQAAGYAVFGYDNHGHGMSSGEKGSLIADNQLVDDLRFVIEYVRRQNPGPLVLVGHSMGGLIAAETAIQNKQGIDLLVMTSPALGADTNPVQKLLLFLLPALLPNVRVDNGVKSQWLARDERVVKEYKNDHLVHRKISARLASWILRTGEKVVREAESWQVPTLLLYSGNDKLVRSKSSDLFSEKAPSHLVEAHCFKEMYHEILNDPEKEKVFTILNQWLAANLK